MNRERNRDLYLGIDLGTSSVKLALIKEDASVFAESSEDYPLLGEENGWFEQRPQDWIDAICRAVRKLDDTEHGVADTEETGSWRERMRSIGLSAQMPTMVLVNDRGVVLRNAIVWCDNRAAQEGRELLALWGEKRHYETCGVFLDGRYLLPMYLWVKKNQPQLLEEEHVLLSAGDYIYYWLTGRMATAPSTASGYGVYDLKERCWNGQMMEEAGVSKHIFPPLRDSFDDSVTLCGETAELLGLSEDVTVACGGADSVVGVFGMGGETEGTVCLICGSSTAILAAKRDLIPKKQNAFFITPMLEDGMAAMEADLLSTGNTQKWLLQRLNEIRGEGCPPLGYREMSNMAALAPPGAEGLLFLPYLAGGEQGVLWDDSLTGGWMGLTLRHRLPHMVRSVYEGICFEILRCIKAFGADGLQVRRILVAGPVGEDQIFMQLLADVLGYPCTVSQETNASAIGAATAAIRAVGGQLSFQKEQAAVYESDPSVHRRYQQIYQQYLAASAGLSISRSPDGV